MTMMLYNKNTGHIYGYFGAPYSTIDDAIEMCFPDSDWNDGYIDDPDYGEVWLDDLETTVLGKGDADKTKYLNFDTGEVWTKEEIRSESDEMSDEKFDEYMDSLLRQGIERTGGIIEMEEIQ